MHIERKTGLRFFLFYSSTIVFLLVAGVKPAVSQTETGEIRGRVVISSADDISDELLRDRKLVRYGKHLHAMVDSVAPYSISEKTAIYIESAPGHSREEEVPLRHAELNQEQMLFHPLVLPVVVGTVVDFPNNDNLFHNVFSYSSPKEFDLGRYPQGQRKSVRFDKPGIEKVYCDIHSYMYATILVLDNPFFASPDNDGNYTISGVPAGSYKISLWYGRKKAGTKNVVVEAGKISQVNFEY